MYQFTSFHIHPPQRNYWHPGCFMACPRRAAVFLYNLSLEDWKSPYSSLSSHISQQPFHQAATKNQGNSIPVLRTMHSAFFFFPPNSFSQLYNPPQNLLYNSQIYKLIFGFAFILLLFLCVSGIINLRARTGPYGSSSNSSRSNSFEDK